MAWTFYLNGTALATERVTLDSATGLTESAESGQPAFSGVAIDDPDGDLDLRGWMSFYVEESEATPTRLYTGYIAPWQISRGGGAWQKGVERTFDCDLVDLNTLLKVRVISGSDGKRPEERVPARLSWLLGSDYLSGLVSDTGFTNPGTADNNNFFATDYRGQYPLDVVSELASTGLRNFYVFWDSDYGTPTASLFYDVPDAAVRVSSVAISNDPTEYDGTAVLAPYYDAVITSDPSEIYSGVYYRWRNGAFYQTDSTTEAGFLARDASVDDGNRSGSLNTAKTKATNFLARSSAEIERAIVTLEMTEAQVNDILPGELVSVHMTNWPGYEEPLSGTPASMRVVHRTVQRHDDPRPYHYEVRLELSNAAPRFAGGGGAGDFPHDDTQPCVPVGDDPFLDATMTAGGDRPPTNPTYANDNDILTWTVFPSGAEWGGTYTSHLIATFPSATGFTSFDIGRDGGWANYSGTPMVEYVSAGTKTIRFYYSDNGSDWTETTYTWSVDSGWITVTPTETNDHQYWRMSRVVVLTGVAYWQWDNIFTWAGDGCVISDAPAPQPGQWVYRDIPTPTPDGVETDFTTTYPFADGSLTVLIDRLDQTGAVTAVDGSAGTFTLDFAPKTGELVECNYQGR